jgi:hypothetical protein
MEDVKDYLHIIIAVFPIQQQNTGSVNKKKSSIQEIMQQ